MLRLHPPNYILPAMLALAFATLCGCGKHSAGVTSATSPGASGKKPMKIAAILMQEDQFFQTVQLGMRDAAKQAGVEFQVGNSFGTIDKEIALAEAYGSQGNQALLVAPQSVTASIPALQRADAEGMKIITYDGIIKADFPAANIQSDQESLGITTAQAVRDYIQTKLGGKAKVAQIEAISISPEVVGARVRGFESVIKTMPGVEVVAKQDAWMAPQAADVVESILSAHPDVNVIWAGNEGGTIGAVTAVRNMNKAGQIVVFGTDISEQMADFLLAPDNILQAVTGQRAYEMGAQALKCAVSVINNQPFEKSVKLPGILFSRADPEATRKYQEFLRGVRLGQPVQAPAAAATPTPAGT